MYLICNKQAKIERDEIQSRLDHLKLSLDEKSTEANETSSNLKQIDDKLALVIEMN